MQPQHKKERIDLKEFYLKQRKTRK